MIQFEVNCMDEQKKTEEYNPRPAWQVWSARVGLVIMIISIITWLYNIANPI